MQASESPLVVAIGRLKAALWGGADTALPSSASLSRTLAKVEHGIREHAAATGPVDELVADLDRPLLPSPGAFRRKLGLRRELTTLMQETRALRNHLRFAGAAAFDELLAGGAEQAIFLERARKLARSLASFSKDEVLFVQESILTDIGAGD